MFLWIRKSLLKLESKVFTKVKLQVRTFSSQDEQYPHLKLFVEIANRDSSFVWPETRLGLLEPKDSRFPFPGLVGSFTHSKNELGQSKNEPFNYEVDLLVHEQNHERQSSIFEQFLSINEQVQKQFSNNESENPLTNFNYTVRECPIFLKHDFQYLFPSVNLLNRRLTIIIFYLNQNDDKVLRINSFFADTANSLCESLHIAGFWADFIDPKSGKPYLGESLHSSSLYETEIRYKKCGLHIEDYKGCVVIKHMMPDAFTGFLLTTAPHNHPLILSLNNHYEN